MSNVKKVHTRDYNLLFDTETGMQMRWGETLNDDPFYCKLGPELLDIEISTICHKACAHCYKSNTGRGKNMSFETFKLIFDKIPKTALTQVALGIGDIDGNPDLWKIMDYITEHGIVPNITINGERMTDHIYYDIVERCGAVSVSFYDKKTCYESVEKLTKLIGKPFKLKQVNIHYILSRESIDNMHQMVFDIKTLPQLKDLNAIVFLSLKEKGDRNKLKSLSTPEDYKKFADIIEFMLKHEIKFGMDSCTASNFMRVIAERMPDKIEAYMKMVESCESTLFSYYINTDGIGFPCSFCEGVEYKGIDLNKVDNFLDQVWQGDETKRHRQALKDSTNGLGCRNCPVYDLEMET